MSNSAATRKICMAFISCWLQARNIQSIQHSSMRCTQCMNSVSRLNKFSLVAIPHSLELIFHSGEISACLKHSCCHWKSSLGGATCLHLQKINVQTMFVVAFQERNEGKKKQKKKLKLWILCTSKTKEQRSHWWVLKNHSFEHFGPPIVVFGTKWLMSNNQWGHNILSCFSATAQLTRLGKFFFLLTNRSFNRWRCPVRQTSPSLKRMISQVMSNYKCQRANQIPFLSSRIKHLSWCLC